MTQANTQYWSRLVKVTNDLFSDSGVGWNARTGRNHDSCRLKSLDLVQRDFVISVDAEFFSQLAEILHEVVGEGIVVIDYENHSSKPRCARLIARIRARDLFTVSIYSLSGTESATIPPPAWM